jgi:anti-sigma regulatory factor (Ser/Thr protein kinase)
MLALGELRLEATTENLCTICEFVQAVGERLELSEKACCDIELAVEEAAANVVRHAYSPDHVGEIVICAEASDDVLYLTITDWGAPFDPSKLKPFDRNAPVEARVNGGMGLYFIENLMDSVVRRAALTPGGPNTLILSKRIQRGPEKCNSPH